jgi:transcription termination factor Rho
LEDKPKELVLFPPKGSYSKAKITPVYNNEPATVVTELKAKVDVPAEVSSQIEAEWGIRVNESSASEKSK